MLGELSNRAAPASAQMLRNGSVRVRDNVNRVNVMHSFPMQLELESNPNSKFSIRKYSLDHCVYELFCLFLETQIDLWFLSFRNAKDQFWCLFLRNCIASKRVGTHSRFIVHMWQRVKPFSLKTFRYAFVRHIPKCYVCLLGNGQSASQHDLVDVVVVVVVSAVIVVSADYWRVLS